MSVFAVCPCFSRISLQFTNKDLHLKHVLMFVSTILSKIGTLSLHTSPLHLVPVGHVRGCALCLLVPLLLEIAVNQCIFASFLFKYVF